MGFLLRSSSNDEGPGRNTQKIKIIEYIMYKHERWRVHTHIHTEYWAVIQPPPQGITLQGTLQIWASNFSILHMLINKANKIKFHESLYAETGKLESAK